MSSPAWIVLRRFAGLLNDAALLNGYDTTFHRLANDTQAKWGYKPVISAGAWRQTNATRYVRAFQSRRSLLVWKVFGQRLDGWTNGDHPTEATPGDAASLPAGANANNADIDYIGTMMPPPGSGVPALSEDEKMTIARWIDLGAPITARDDTSYAGYFADELKPTLTLASPRAGIAVTALNEIRIGMFDAYSGIDNASLSVVADFSVNGMPIGSELAPFFKETDASVWVMPLAQPLTHLTNGHLTISVKDKAGNITTLTRRFSVRAPTTPASLPTRGRPRLSLRP